MKIGLDFDGVITDCGKLKSETAKKLYGINIPSSRFKKEVVVGEGHLTLDQYRELQKIIYCTPEVGHLIEAVPEMKEAIFKLKKDGHELIVITSRTEDALKVAKGWSEKNDLDFKYIGVGYGNSKKEAASAVDLYVDDDLDKLVDLQNVVPNLFLFSWPYNQHEMLPEKIRRVNNWKHLVETIESIKF